jgi:hypothetical protein
VSNLLEKKMPDDLRARTQPQRAPSTQDVNRSMFTHQPSSESFRTDFNRPSALGMLQAANASRALTADRSNMPPTCNTMSDFESDEEDHEVCSSPVKQEPDLADVMRNMESSFSELS